MRFSALALLASLTTLGWAQPSFDLMYLPSSTTGRVIRYDPVNRIQLGGWASSGATSIIYRGGPYGIVRGATSSYRTAMYSGIADALFGAAQFSNLSGDSSIVHGFTTGSVISVGLLSLNTTVTTLSGTVAAFSGTRLSGGNFVVFGSTGFAVNLTTYNSAGAILGSVSTGTGITRSGGSTTVLTSDYLGGTWARTVVRSSTTAQHLVSVQIDPATGLPVGAPAVSSLLPFSTIHNVAIAPAHMGFYLIGSDSTTNTLTRFVKYDSNFTPGQTDSWTENFDTRNTNSIYSVGMVLAPEPGTMIALGAGVAALLQRRRKKHN